MEQSEFEKLVNEGVAQIPARFLKLLKNVAIVVEQAPTTEQTKKLRLRKDHLLFGLYEGVPQTKRGAYYSALPDKITIFKHPIERYAQTPEEIREIIKNTVWHEIAHHFGLGEDVIREVERRRRKIRN